MNADKITLASYIAYLQGMYKRYGNISIAQLKHIERNRKKGGKAMSTTTAINEIIHIRREVYDRKRNLFDPSVPIDMVLEWLDNIQIKLED